MSFFFIALMSICRVFPNLISAHSILANRKTRGGHRTTKQNCQDRTVGKGQLEHESQNWDSQNGTGRK